MSGYRIQQVVSREGYHIDLPDLYGSLESAKIVLEWERARGNRVRVVEVNHDGHGGERVVVGWDTSAVG